MTTDLSIIELIMGASLIVKLVMLSLVLASLTSWTMIFSKHKILNDARKQADKFEEVFWSTEDLTPLYTRISSKRVKTAGMEKLFDAGFKEFARLKKQKNIDPDAILEGAQRAMRVTLNKEIEALEQNLPFLATVGSTSPYIGLFGTVWGIMHSFRGLANATQATLATVAPGISEALIATAMGLFAAIPAVLAYNRFAARVDNLINRYDTFVDEFSGILQRQTYAQRARQQQG